MKIRYLTKTTYYGDMLIGEKNEYETILQYKENGVWRDVKTVKE